MTDYEDAEALPPQPDEQPTDQREASHTLRTLAIVVVGVVVLGGAVLGAWFYVTVNTPVTVPQIVGLTPAAASKALAKADLGDGRANWEVTRQFPAGLVISQHPRAQVGAAHETSVDVEVAVTPAPVTVPDVVQAESDDAQSALNATLLSPDLRYAYSKTVEVGRVIEQLPRAGDEAITGSPEVLVVSLGPGTSGRKVPSLLGLTTRQASLEASSATLLPSLRAVLAPGVADGIVVDQAPSAGLLVPAASTVTLSVASGTSF